MAGEPPIQDPIEARYVNYFGVGYNVHEFLFDFAQFHVWDVREVRNSGPVGIVRIVMGPSFAKAFVQMLGQAIHQYEERHGRIES